MFNATRSQMEHLLPCGGKATTTTSAPSSLTELTRVSKLKVSAVASDSVAAGSWRSRLLRSPRALSRRLSRPTLPSSAVVICRRLWRWLFSSMTLTVMFPRSLRLRLWVRACPRTSTCSTAKGRSSRCPVRRRMANGNGSFSSGGTCRRGNARLFPWSMRMGTLSSWVKTWVFPIVKRFAWVTSTGSCRGVGMLSLSTRRVARDVTCFRLIRQGMGRTDTW